MFCFFFFFFFNHTATTEIYTLSLHDALPISAITRKNGELVVPDQPVVPFIEGDGTGPDIWRASVRVFDADRKSTRLNSSHSQISYAVFCLKKKKKKIKRYCYLCKNHYYTMRD